MLCPGPALKHAGRKASELINRSCLRIALINSFAQFGSDLDASTRYLLNRGARLTELLKQGQYQVIFHPLWGSCRTRGDYEALTRIHILIFYQPLSTEVQVPIIYAGVNGLLDDVPVERIVEWEAQFRQHLTSEQQDLLKDVSGGVMTKEIESKLTEVVKANVSSFVSK